LHIIDGICKGTAFDNKIYEEVIKRPNFGSSMNKAKAEIITDEWQQLLNRKHGIKNPSE